MQTSNEDVRRARITQLHRWVTTEILKLIEGLYTNLDDGLFELAHRAEDDLGRGKLFDLARVLHDGKANVLREFESRLDHAGQRWHSPSEPQIGFSADVRQQSQLMVQRCEGHLGMVLQSIASRASVLTRRQHHPDDLPFGPQSITNEFLIALDSSSPGADGKKAACALFSRFVLDRLGTVYGRCNTILQAPKASERPRQSQRPQQFAAG